MSDDHYIEFTAIIGPIDEPHALHIHDGKGGVHDTEHGRLAQRLFDTVADIVQADMAAHVTTDNATRSALIVERNRLRTVADAARTLIQELDANPIGEYGDAVCEAIDVLDAKLQTTKEAT